jgi:diadenosine tetraphosphate (Ap4A) HIT family hydrolase
MDCPFCSQKIEEESVLQNELCYFLQREEPILIGSGLIIPKRHCRTVFDLNAAEWQATYSLIQSVKELLDGTYHPDGYNLGWNCETTAGQEIFHAHLHVIPRYDDEPLAGQGIRYLLKQENNRLT